MYICLNSAKIEVVIKNAVKVEPKLVNLSQLGIVDRNLVLGVKWLELGLQSILTRLFIE